MRLRDCDAFTRTADGLDRAEMTWRAGLIIDSSEFISVVADGLAWTWGYGVFGYSDTRIGTRGQWSVAGSVGRVLICGG